MVPTPGESCWFHHNVGEQAGRSACRRVLQSYPFGFGEFEAPGNQMRPKTKRFIARTSGFGDECFLERIPLEHQSKTGREPWLVGVRLYQSL